MNLCPSLDAVKLMMNGTKALARVEEVGVAIHVERLERTIKETEDEIRSIVKVLESDDIYKIWRREYGAKTKLGSNVQLADILYNKMGIECKSWTSGGSSGKSKPSVSEEALQDIKIPFVTKLFEMKHLDKTVSTFLKGMLREVVDGRIHPFYHLNTTVTFRSSCVAKGTLIEVVRDVSTCDKGIPIENVRAGDYVYCYDDNLNLAVRKVLWTGKTGTKKIIRIHWTARGKRGHLDLTPEHKVRLIDGSYVEAKNLIYDNCASEVRVLSTEGNGDRDWQTKDGSYKLLSHCVITSITYTEETVDVYDIEVEEFHNFIANEICVHNSSSPNWQNLPKRDIDLAKRVRRSVVASKGMHLWELDFKGAEVCVAAAVTGDKALQDYVRDKTKDMHRDMAMQLFRLDKEQMTKGIRNLAKQYFVFAQFYGDYYVKCAKNLWENAVREKQRLPDGRSLVKHLRSAGIREMGECCGGKDPRSGTFEAHVREVERDFWGNRFKTYAEWKKRWWNEYQEKGYFITPTGFLVKMGKSGPLTKNECNNNPIQGSSFHCDLWTLIQLQKWMIKNRMESEITGQIHDSQIGESPPDEIGDVLTEACRIVKEDLPAHYKWLNVPMEIEISVADVGGSWWNMREWTCRKGKWAPKEMSV